jgi:hypothetical protein
MDKKQTESQAERVSRSADNDGLKVGSDLPNK